MTATIYNEEKMYKHWKKPTITRILVQNETCIGEEMGNGSALGQTLLKAVCLVESSLTLLELA